ncbi:DNA-directed RNA polymerase subunit beta' ['Crotalaria aegyptiaca' phytoplasma]|uniref:DNA-directed RNA polymerase subunit beta' n=1 Tax=Candidatus Phytoplasma crotalariae TaxID=2982627 RepID=A0ABT9D266_9MOLU|nr:DNA-directed RNA polymerase subunit beta' ['Crotalaria aegyptiaca' phytoplasma]MDO8059053.1 DNA-directed RNA polymerase subunit beta' ['Crotalaria aegyptiaca' phytoplasma]
MLNMKIEDFTLTKRTLKNLKSIGINSLNDINNYHLNELVSLLNEESFREFIVILKKYGLPESLNNLNLNQEVLDILCQNNIFNCFSLLTTDKDVLLKLFSYNHSHQDLVMNILNLYNGSKNNFNQKIDNSVADIEDIVLKNENNENESASSWIIDKAIFANNSNREYDYFKIRLSSPHEIRQKSYGEVVNYETINYRTAKPEKGGLFCPIIFGPVQDLQCICSKKQTLKKGQICSKCGVEITEQLVRRERMGHIDLAAPVVHTWFLNSLPSRLAILLGMKAKELAEIVYYVSYIVINPGNSDLTKYSIISELEYGQYLERCDNNFVALTGAEAVKTMLKELNMEETIQSLRLELKQASKQKRDSIVKRLELMESFYQSDNKPEWIVLEAINVIPPSLRPIVALEQGVRFASADINDLYRRILNRNNRLKRQLKQNAPRLIIKNEKRMLQEAVDALFDNAKSSKKSTSNIERNKPLKSLSEMLRGKQGRFRQNLLGKRVDYSGRSVIIVGPDLKLHQCGIPRQMAIVLFKPFVLNKLQESKGIDKKSANILYEKMNEHVWKLLEEVVQEHPVLLNRAPTLHRQGLQGFQVKLIDGKAIRLHPLVTLAFNADFDGDQMAVYVPLSVEAQAEARLLMLSSYNILDPKNGSPVLSPSQDMVLGNYYLTIEETRKRIIKGYNSDSRNEQHRYKHRNEGKVFNDLQEAELAFYNKQIALHTRILVRVSNISSYFDDNQKNKYLVTTLGKLIFNSILPNDFPYLQEPTIFNLEIKTPDVYFIPKGVHLNEYLNNIPTPEPFKKRFLSLIIDRVFKRSNISETSKMLDDIKNLGFKYSTMSGVTISHADINVYSKKDELIAQVENKIIEIEQWHDKGFLTTSEKKSLIIQEWKNVRNVIQEGLMQEFNQDNHLFMISDSGARGNVSNFAQLSGMRGLMHSPTNNQLEIPVKSSFKEGLNVHEFFISTHGARKVSTDTALKTAESGYLTRRLVDVAQDVIIMLNDCGSDKGVYVTSLEQDGKEIISLQQRLFGRYIAQSIVDPLNKQVIVNFGELITREIAENIVKIGFLSVKIRSVLTCNSDYGICAKCYGLNLATNKAVEIGEAVGIIAAQSIGEPGTQLTMRTFHTGGVLSVSDITQGLPRIQELFEARKPKGKALISEYDGVIKEIKSSNLYSSDIVIVSAINPQQEYIYTVDSNVDILVNDGMAIKAGQRLTSGSIDLRELLRISSVVTTQKYILEEVQQVYQSQSVYISDKHIEIIIRQMFKQILVISEGDSNLLPGSEVSIKEFKRINMQLIQQNKKLAAGRPIVLGITRSSLKSDSLLSAASFQETTKILIDATIKGQKDFLLGLKENVILGGLIPAGTGILNHSLFEYPLTEEDKNK